MGTGGCFTWKSDGDKMRTDLDALTQRVGDEEDQWKASVNNYKAEVDQLHETLKEAQQLMARNSADIGQQVQTLQVKIATAQGDVDTMQKQLADLQKSFGDYKTQNDAAVTSLTKIVMTPASAPTPSTLFDKAYSEYMDKQFDDAAKDFRDFTLQFPFDPKAPDAQYWVGMSFFQQAAAATDPVDGETDYQKAVPEFQKVLDNFPNASYADSAMLYEGEAFFMVKWCGPALGMLQALPSKYPSSTLLTQAKQLTTQVQAAQKTKGSCLR
jgi:TolA-binding protein